MAPADKNNNSDGAAAPSRFPSRPLALILLAIALLSLAAPLAFAVDDALGEERLVSRDLGLLLGYFEVILLTILLILLIAILLSEVAAAQPALAPVTGLLANPLVLAAFILLGLALGAYAGMQMLAGTLAETNDRIIAIAAGAAAFPLALLLALAFIADTYRKHLFALVLGLAAWGLFAAFAAFALNTGASELLELAFNPQLADFILIVLLIPFIEEGAKGLGVLVLRRQYGLPGPALGILAGFTVGIGFATIENWVYFIANTSPLYDGVAAWAQTILARTFFACVGHGLFTAATGWQASLGPGPRYALGGILLAAGAHMVFNLIPYATDYAFAKPAFILFLALGMLYIIFRAKADRERQQEIRRLDEQRRVQQAFAQENGRMAKTGRRGPGQVI